VVRKKGVPRRRAVENEVKTKAEASGLRPLRRDQAAGGLCIARTVAVRAEVILFDEPCFGGFGPISTAKDRGLIQELSGRGLQIAIVTHTSAGRAAAFRTRTGPSCILR